MIGSKNKRGNNRKVAAPNSKQSLELLNQGSLNQKQITKLFDKY